MKSSSQSGLSIVLVLSFMILATIITTAVLKISTHADIGSIHNMQMKTSDAALNSGRDAAHLWMSNKGFEFAAALQTYYNQVKNPAIADPEPVVLPMDSISDENGQSFKAYITGGNFEVDSSEPLPVKIQVIAQLKQGNKVISNRAKEYIFNVNGIYLEENKIVIPVNTKIPTDALYLGGRTERINAEVEIIGDFYSAYRFENSAKVHVKGDMLMGGEETDNVHGIDHMAISDSLIIDGNFYSHVGIKTDTMGVLYVKGNAEFGNGDFVICTTCEIRVGGDSYLKSVNNRAGWHWLGNFWAESGFKVEGSFIPEGFTGQLDVSGNAEFSGEINKGDFVLRDESSFYDNVSGTSNIDNKEAVYSINNIASLLGDSTKLKFGPESSWGSKPTFSFDRPDYLFKSLNPNVDHLKISDQFNFDPAFVSKYGKSFSAWGGSRDAKNLISASELNRLYLTASAKEKPSDFLVVTITDASNDLMASNPTGDLLKGNFIFVIETKGTAYKLGNDAETQFPAMDPSARVMFWIRDGSHLESFSVTPRNGVGTCYCFVYTESASDQFGLGTATDGMQQHILGSVHVDTAASTNRVKLSGFHQNSSFKFEYDQDVLVDIFSVQGLLMDSSNTWSDSNLTIDTNVVVYSPTLKLDLLGSYEIDMDNQVREEDIDGDNISGKLDDVDVAAPYLSLTRSSISIDTSAYATVNEMKDSIGLDGVISFRGRFSSLKNFSLRSYCKVEWDYSDLPDVALKSKSIKKIVVTVKCKDPETGETVEASRTFVVYIGQGVTTIGSGSSSNSYSSGGNSSNVYQSSSSQSRNCKQDAWDKTIDYPTGDIIAYNEEDWQASKGNQGVEPPGKYKVNGCIEDAFTLNKSYNLGDIVSYKDKKLSCKVPSFCSQVAYSPSGISWTAAWADLGACVVAEVEKEYWQSLGACEEVKDPAQLASFKGGETFASADVEFAWTQSYHSEATGYALNVGNTSDSKAYFSGDWDVLDHLSQKISGLPEDGSVILVELWTKFKGGDIKILYSFNAKGIASGNNYSIREDALTGEYQNNCSVSKSPDQFSYSSGTKVSLSISCLPISESYTTINWTSKGSNIGSGSGVVIVMNEDKEISAEINRLSYSLQFLVNSGEGSFDFSSSVPSKKVSVLAGETTSISIYPSSGYRFKEWGDGDTQASRTFGPIFKGASYQAVMEKDGSAGYSSLVQVSSSSQILSGICTGLSTWETGKGLADGGDFCAGDEVVYSGSAWKSTYCNSNEPGSGQYNGWDYLGKCP